ncbi:MAG: porin family protein [Ferruginibacter sp.]
MKKLFLIAAISALTFSAKSQTSFGFQVGGNYGNVSSEETSGSTTQELKTDGRLGFLIGALAQVPLTSSLYFRPELNFIQKGAEFDFSENDLGITYASKGDLRLNFIEIPLNLAYMAPAGAGNVFFTAGPSLGFGIKGKINSTQTASAPGFPNQVSSENGDIIFDGKKDADVPVSDMDYHLKRFDLGLNASIGYKLANGFFLNLGYTYGLSNLEPNDNSSFKTKGLTLKLGYLFGSAGEK